MQYTNVGILLQNTSPAEFCQIWWKVTHSEYVLIAMHLAHMRMQAMNCWFAVGLCNEVTIFLGAFLFAQKGKFTVQGLHCGFCIFSALDICFDLHLEWY